jgi:hypothetical protein
MLREDVKRKMANGRGKTRLEEQGPRLKEILNTECRIMNNEHRGVNCPSKEKLNFGFRN